MKTSIFCTNSSITLDSGGGIVCYNIIQALKTVTELKTVMCNRSIPLEVPIRVISPAFYQQPENPFLYDYFASSFAEKVDIAQFYGAPFGQTVAKLCLLHHPKILVDIAPHNIELSREEHQRLGLPFPYPHLNKNLWQLLYMLHVKVADVVIFHSKSSAEYIKKELGLTNEIRVIPHGCDLPKEIKPLPPKFVVAHVGVNGPDKGQCYLMLAWEGLGLKDADIILAGLGTEYWTKGCGQVNDIAKIYEQCSVYVQPTVTEGFGIPVLEAMAYGRPVIVTEGAGVSELIEDGKEGFVVPIRSPEAIAEQIRYFYDNPSEIKRMGANARQKAEQYTWEKIRKKYEEMYLQ